MMIGFTARRTFHSACLVSTLARTGQHHHINLPDVPIAPSSAASLLRHAGTVCVDEGARCYKQDRRRHKRRDGESENEVWCSSTGR